LTDVVRYLIQDGSCKVAWGRRLESGASLPRGTGRGASAIIAVQ